jgi:uncharacterized Ntn-hydrolase superfamily protein
MTFSLAGRCARTGMLGAVVTTSSIAVGARCSHARTNIGAVLSQYCTDPRLGSVALDLLARGCTAEETKKEIIAATRQREWRQLAIIDRHGGTASFSGARVAGEKDEAHGKDCVAIANIVRSAAVPRAMVRAFEAAHAASLAQRLLHAIRAGEAAGGEFQPVVSAALLVVHRESFPYIDLRVDHNASPIEELARLLSVYEPEADSYIARAIDPDQAMRS